MSAQAINAIGHSKSTDNAQVLSKVNLRTQAVQGLDTVKVLDLFAGKNKLWSTIPTDRYFGVEREKGKGKNLTGDNLKIIPSLDLSRFTVIDCDSYGIPYPQIKALYRNKTLQKGTIIIYTCITNAISSMSKECLQDFGLEEMYKKCKTPINALSADLFFEMIRMHGVERVMEYKITGSFSKRYGYFKVV